jgi:hypothetical protein
MEMVRVFTEGNERIKEAVTSVDGDIVKLLSWKDKEVEKTDPDDLEYALYSLLAWGGELIHAYVNRDGESLEQKLDRLKDLKFPLKAIRRRLPPSDSTAITALAQIQKTIHLLPEYTKLVDVVNRVPSSAEEKARLFMKVAEGAGSYKDITLLLLASCVIGSSWCTNVLSHMKMTDIRRTIELASSSERVTTPSRSLSVVGQCPLLPEILEIALKAVNMKDDRARDQILLGCFCTLGFRWLPDFVKIFPEPEKLMVRTFLSWNFLADAICQYALFLIGRLSPSRTLDEMTHFFKLWVNGDPFGSARSILNTIRREKGVSEGFGILFALACHPGEKEDVERRLERVMQSLSAIPEFNL